jgi:hypothetical protein
MKKIVCILLAALFAVGGLGAAPVVYADDLEDSEGYAIPENIEDGEAVVSGPGTLVAKGDGIALLGGRGIVWLRGNGILWVQDVGGDATVRVTGYGSKKEYSDGWVQYAGYHGAALIKGSRIRVVVAGADLHLRAKGRGRALLWGHGRYETGGVSEDWKSTGIGGSVRFTIPQE